MSTPRLVTGSPPTPNLEREEYQAALHSWLFERAPGQAKLFSYICEKYFAGQSEQLKEYTVAAEVFGRSTDFNSRQDPIVRVNINRLRHALRRYYRTEGRNHAIQIAIPSGRYVPYRSRREGRFSYRIPLSPGCYELHLHFLETEPKDFPAGASGRLFDIVLNGQTVERDFDVALQAGGYNTPLSRVFTDVRPASDGFVAIDFRTSRSWPTLSGIEIMPGTPGRMLPVRFTAQTTTYMADDRAIWRPDHHYIGGRAVTRGQRITATPDPGLFRGERYGSFRYSIPVSPGKYTVRLFFAEAHFGPSNPGAGGEASRLFDVFCNGKALLHDFDVFKEAGGENRALVRSFEGLEPDPRRKLVLDFIARRNNAMVNAIEVEAE